ncbi:PcfK-like family protein, partial [Bacteroides pyogenes]|uniref:PcfK-like family protein n=1 Tax=Bacteroides pyogenes TaxID=310300 RepID=UPI002FDAE8CD
GLSDEEVYSLAVHYYDEDNLKVGKPINCKVVVNHTIELTEEEKVEARQNAIKQYQREELAKIRNRNARPKKAETTEIASQPSLFEF